MQSVLERKSLEIDGCPKFGWNFDKEHPMCKQCKRASQCFSFSAQDERKRKIGYKPRIPKAKRKRGNTLPLQVSLPTIQNGKIQITLRVDLAWLREHAKSEYGTENYWLIHPPSSNAAFFAKFRPTGFFSANFLLKPLKTPILTSFINNLTQSYPMERSKQNSKNN